MPNAVRIAVTGTSEDAQRAINEANRAARDASTQGLADLRASLLSLAPAAIPIVAAAAPLAAHLGAGAVAAAAFGAALIPQVKSLGDVTAAQGKYDTAVKQYGPHSAQAAQASASLAKSITSLPPETQKAAAAFLNLKTTYKGWSDQLSKATVPVFTKSLEVANALLPKTSGLVLGASTQFDRLVTALGGAVSTPGFDAMDKKFTAFATGSLKSLVDGVVRLSRALSEGKANGPAQQFMAYARKEGPAVRATLENLGKALLHTGQAAANAGPGMLTIVNALAKLVAAVPAPVLTRLIQMYTAMRLIGLASAGITVAGRAFEATAARAVLMGRSMAAASGASATLSAGLAGLSTGAKLGGVVLAFGALYLALKKFQGAGVTPDVDRLTTALGTLGDTGKVTGEAARVFGVDLSGLADDIDKLNGKKDGLDHFNDVMNKVLSFGLASSNGPKQATKDINAIDDSLANLVKGGHADLAAAALADLQKQSGKKIPTKSLDDYASAQKDAAYETKLTAQSMGVFGAQSTAVQKTLDKQKQSAQGLQQAILDLNDANRAGLDAESDFQQAIDDGTKAIKGHGNALHFTNGELDLNTQASRDAYGALSKVASTAGAASTAALQQGKSQNYANGILIKAHDQLVTLGKSMGLTGKEANKLADELDNIKDPKIKMTATAAQLNTTIANANKKLAALPKGHSTALRADAAQLKNVIADARKRLDALNGKTAHTYVTTTYTTSGTVAHEGGGYATGGPVGLGRRAGTAATGGPRSNLTWVGEGGPELVNLAPGSSVRPHANSMMDARGGGAQRIVLEILDKGHTAYTAFLVQALREAVDTRGGNVQLAIMGRG